MGTPAPPGLCTGNARRVPDAGCLCAAGLLLAHCWLPLPAAVLVASAISIPHGAHSHLRHTQDILPAFRDATEGDAHLGIKIAAVVTPILPFVFLASASVCMAMLWTNEGTAARHPSADGAAIGFKICIVGLALSVCGLFVCFGRFLAQKCTSYLAAHNLVDDATNTVAGAVIRASEAAEVAISGEIAGAAEHGVEEIMETGEAGRVAGAQVVEWGKHEGGEAAGKAVVDKGDPSGSAVPPEGNI